MDDSDSPDSPRPSTLHWGEIPEDPGPITIPDVSTDIKKAMEPNCLSDYEETGNLYEVVKVSFPPLDPLIFYAIELHKYMNTMTDIIRTAELTNEAELKTPEDGKPPMPEMPEIKPKHKPNNLNFVPKEPLLESSKKEYTVLDISEELVRKILEKSIAIMFAHLGFETAFQSAYDVLVDVLDDFFKKVCSRFVTALNDEEQFQTGGFPNVIERVLVELGLGGAKGIHEYYQCRVIKYINVLQKRCKELDQRYMQMIEPKNDQNLGEIEQLFGIKVKEEDETMETEAEIHFPEGEIINPTGYQLLSSLEAEIEPGLMEINTGI